MTNKQLLPLLILMVIFSPLAIDIFLPALPIMAKEFVVPMTQIQWSVTIFILSLGFGQLISGPLADRYGRRPVAMGGILIYGLASLISAYADSLTFFLIGRLLQGVGACAIVVSAFASVRDKYNAIESGVMYSYLNSAICCIPALAPLLGNFLTESFGWRSNFEFMTGYAIFAGVILYFTLKETRPEQTAKHKHLFNLTHFIPVLKHPVFLFNALVVMLSMAIIIAYVSSSPAWLIVRLGLDQQSFVFWFSLNAVINIVACFLAPRVLIKFGARITIGLGMVLLSIAGLLMLALLDFQTPIAFMLPIMVSSLGFSVLMGACAGQALAPFGEKAGSASALLGFVQMSGSAVIVYLLQLLPLNEAEQLAWLMLTIIPVYVIWKLPRVKTHIMLDN
ncbi:multidrug effflux MFS transporter [Colwellia sp. 4_MG-2023]|jgi:DHA1 family bicyclomycin/chloramphenicol resistance-like MFS transporter|uniref:multidrug effflux MFS transporter n=1 Tax=unclassified Colwellia TaxID=196834 RepID=UPI001C0A15C9|nr:MULTISPECIES: multidrug effflux MFS transporter [unclassified Colwellia]MBU2925873.1 multidrug effflux MFS transporter [Colwellia sp. C2M11]MDO6508236.1 multidrug effflux MFS transporter [Colwellia sp. 5_MG-2023]MDO6555315.1 multidrug effflux MFS transporter [Colwellia sp. 4_MG-2023]MDO6652729.1 multidrug effflux MFS transporter [Colwellia sp. 3_MG-2023]MDO6665604.1 multidrug effflux MFS transporter [Colwellia sp. 2_MG-2023]